MIFTISCGLKILSAFAEDHGFYPWMNAIGNATADVAYPNWRITRRSLGIGGYFNEVPRALPVGLHAGSLKSKEHLVRIQMEGRAFIEFF